MAGGYFACRGCYRYAWEVSSFVPFPRRNKDETRGPGLHSFWENYRCDGYGLQLLPHMHRNFASPLVALTFL